VKIAAVGIGVFALGGTILLVIANASSSHSNAMGPLALLCCIVAVIVMIVLGVTLGGRGDPRGGPVAGKAHRAADIEDRKQEGHDA
jgi:hypothetical protein